MIQVPVDYSKASGFHSKYNGMPLKGFHQVVTGSDLCFGKIPLADV